MKPLNTQIMGIINATPDSFYDGGRYHTVDRAVDHALQLVEQGADIIDIGGESTRPGAAAVSTECELERVIPVIEKIAALVSTPISVDTTKSEVAGHACAAGASFINDISGMTFDSSMLSVAARTNAHIVIMHTRGRPDTMQHNVSYTDIVTEISAFLQNRIDAAINAGIPKDHIVIDPGIGFGKSVEHNYILLNRIRDFKQLGCRVLIGLSRKSLIGNIQPEGSDRLAATLTLNMCAVQNGADIIRVHDVRDHRFALNALHMLQSCRTE